MNWLSELYGFIKGTARKYGAENGSLIAAAVSFYALLSLIPLLLLAVSVAGYVLGSSDKAFSAVSGIFAQMAPSPEFITDVLHGVVQARGTIGLVGLLALLWTGSQFFVILQTALDDIWEVREKPGYIKGRLKAILLVIVFGLFLMLSVASTSVLHFVRGPSIVVAVAAVAVSLVAAIIMFLVIYKYAPDRRVNFWPALTGAVFSAIAWTIAKELYRLYLTYANFNRLYGSLGSVVILILWIYYSSVITVFGGELAYAIEHGPQEQPEEAERMQE